MPVVTLCRSLGVKDRDRYGVTKDAAQEGGKIDVSQEHADALVARGLAMPVEVKAIPPQAVAAVPASDVEAEKSKKSKDKA